MHAESRSALPGRSGYVSSFLRGDVVLLMVYRVALKRPVPPENVAKSILFLASENWSGSITGQVMNVDSGKQGKVMWMRKECWG